MRTSLLASLVVTTLATGCSCGAFTGGGDTVLSRGSDSLVLCENGGFVANLPTGVIEGRYTEATDGSGGGTGVRGDTGAVAFVLTDNPDGSVSTTLIGDQPWMRMTLDKVALDHADVQCTDLQNRPWWGTP